MSDKALQQPARKARDYEEQVFETGSRIAIKPLFESADIGDFDAGRDIHLSGVRCSQ